MGRKWLSGHSGQVFGWASYVQVRSGHFGIEMCRHSKYDQSLPNMPNSTKLTIKEWNSEDIFMLPQGAARHLPNRKLLIYFHWLSRVEDISIYSLVSLTLHISAQNNNFNDGLISNPGRNMTNLCVLQGTKFCHNKELYFLPRNYIFYQSCVSSMNQFVNTVCVLWNGSFQQQ